MNDVTKEIAMNLSRAIMHGRWEEVDALLTNDFFYVGDGKPAINKTQYIAFMRHALCSAMTEMDMQFWRVIAEGNLVAVDYTNEMTHSGSFFGIAATGRRVHTTGQFIREIKEGKVSAEWQATNALGLMQQLGAIPAQG